MTNTEIAEAIAYLVPNPELVLVGHTLDGLTWLDERPIPSKAEIEKAVKDLVKIKKAEAETKAAAKSAILDRIGLTADELKTILG
jgi:hypothetical protein